MRSIEQIKQYLIAHGWTYEGNCNCGGIHTDKFEFKTDIGSYKIKYRYSNFLISTPNKKSKRYPIKELKPIIDELFQNHKAAISSETEI